MSTYVEDYFDRHAHAWLEEAYATGETPSAFPLGEERLRLALGAVADRVPPGGSLVDLGCGGGQLCAVAAGLGFRVTGVDVAPGMIEEAEGLREQLDPADGARITLVTAALDDAELPEEAFDAATAMGLIEYLPNDAALFDPARRMLKPGGTLAVSCRNRLYNLQSANAYTARELEEGTATELLVELTAHLAAVEAGDLRALARELALRAGLLERAASADESEPAPDYLGHATAFQEKRRQHTPAEIESSASEAGFETAAILALHPHPLPPGLEQVSPRVYNQLVLAWQRTLADSAAGLASSSAFVAVFTAPS